ncbi:MAG: hypothetical protein IPP55_16925 [Anaerolineales bacterium]|nr:hypothetical protein [Anaerolineales bacterium]
MFVVLEQYGDSTQLLFLRARYYDPADGRFQSRDTWSGDVNRPLSLNQWMYVEGKPINFTDPTGNEPKGPGSCYDYDPVSGHCASVGIQPVFGEPDIPLSSGLLENFPDAQLNPIAGDMETNLCGQVALSMIASEITGGENHLSNIWQNTGSTQSPTDAYTLLYAAIKTFGNLWAGKAYYYSQSYYLDSDEIAKISSFPNNNWWFEGGVFDGEESWSGSPYGTNAASALRQKLASGHRLLALATLKESGEWRPLVTGTGILHWVLITGFSTNWNEIDENSNRNYVRINNPYNNRKEVYMWRDFKASIANNGWGLVELWKK